MIIIISRREASWILKPYTPAVNLDPFKQSHNRPKSTQPRVTHFPQKFKTQFFFVEKAIQERIILSRGKATSILMLTRSFGDTLGDHVDLPVPGPHNVEDLA